MDSEKAINSFQIKRKYVTFLFMGHFFWWFGDKFSALLICKIYTQQNTSVKFTEYWIQAIPEQRII